MENNSPIFPKESGWWWVLSNGEPTIIKVDFRPDYDKLYPWTEVIISFRFGGRSLEFGYMDKATGAYIWHDGKPVDQSKSSLEWVKQIPALEK